MCPEITVDNGIEVVKTRFGTRIAPMWWSGTAVGCPCVRVDLPKACKPVFQPSPNHADGKDNVESSSTKLEANRKHALEPRLKTNQTAWSEGPST